MVHTRSPEKKEARFLRALDRKFYVPKLSGTTFIQVDASIARRVKVVAKSMQTHRDHCKRANRNCHYAMQSALAARPLLTDGEFRRARDVHKSAGAAKHEWADALDEEIAARSPAAVLPDGGAIDLSSADREGDDPVFINGPWALGARSLCSQRRDQAAAGMADEVVEMVRGASTLASPVPQLRPDAPCFTPPNAFEGGDLCSWRELAFAQQNTLALLAAKLAPADPVPAAPAGGDLQIGSISRGPSDELAVRVLKAQMKATSESISRLTSSLGQAVEDSVTKKASCLEVPDLTKYATLDLCKEQANDTRSLICEVAEALKVDISSSTKSICADAATSACQHALKAIVEKMKVFLSKVEELQCCYDSLQSRIELIESRCLGDAAPFAASGGVSAMGSSPLEAAAACPSSASSRVLDAAPAIASPPVEQWRHVGDLVRLVGLKALELNDRVGTVTDFLQGSERCGVLVQGAAKPKAIKVQNLADYAPQDSDTCIKCKEYCNLFSVPACGCSLGSAMERGGDDEASNEENEDLSADLHALLNDHPPTTPNISSERELC